MTTGHRLFCKEFLSSYALTCALLNYRVHISVRRKELAPIRPVIKFMSIKALIFFTWIQSVAITVLEGPPSTRSQMRTCTLGAYCPFGAVW